MIAIIDYNAGNIRSVANALSRLGCQSVVTDDKALIVSADKVIVPGVGEASCAMKHLRGKGLDNVIRELRQPVLGICLGLQLMCRYSEEGETSGLGIFNTDVRRFPPEDKIPHMGWNSIENPSGPLFSGVAAGSDVYFVHGYYAGLCCETTSVTSYILPLSSSLRKGNFFATQFHPEKSGLTGELILKNFLDL